MLFALCGLASGIFNGNSLSVTVLGTFDYLKNFLVIFIYAAFFRDAYKLKKIFNLLLKVAVLLGIVALMQFAWAMTSVHIFGKEIADKSVYIFTAAPVNDVDEIWRNGIFRAPSLTYHNYILGLFNLLIFTIYAFTAVRVEVKTLIPVVFGVISSVARMAYGGFIFVVSMLVFRRHKRFLPVLLCVLLVMSSIIIFYYSSQVEWITDLRGLQDQVKSDYENIRLYSMLKSLEIWQDHPNLGVGPGTFGGATAFKYNSSVNRVYNVKLGYLEKIGSIELFWFQILAEMGIAGALLFFNLIIFLFLMLYKLREQTVSHDMKNLFSALIVFIPCILIYTIGSGINIAPVFFTYCAFVGIGMGCRDDQRTEEITD
ncbi:MAG: O-antigen ligase family protein [Nitrospirota bacterium]